MLASCSSTPPSTSPKPTSLVWPAAPDPPRIAYVKSIATPADIGRGASRFKRTLYFVTGTPIEVPSLVKPFGIALDESGNICLTDTGDSTVHLFDFQRKQWRSWDSVGKTRFASPVAIARRHSVFYVADSELGKIVAFGEDGREVMSIGSPLERPTGLALSSDSLIVADSQAHAIFVFDLRGELRFRFGTRGAGPGEFNFPTHVAIDPQGRILVTDSLNNRVQLFDSQGKFISQIGSAGDAPGHFGRPKGVAADSFGHIYVVDAMFDNVQIFDASGQLLLNWGEGGTDPGQFGVPSGIAISPENLIYVVDSYNRRVQVFKYLGQQ